MASGDITHAEIVGTALNTTATTTTYTVPASKTAIFVDLWFCNFDTSARQLEIRRVESGGISGNTKRVYKDGAATAMQPGETRRIAFTGLLTGTVLQCSIDSGTSVNVSGSVTLKEN